MAKGIYKQKGSAFYWIRYAGLDGRIIRESAKTNNYKEAQAKLEDRRKAIREGKEPEPIKKITNYTFLRLPQSIPNGAKSKRALTPKYISLTN